MTILINISPIGIDLNMIFLKRTEMVVGRLLNIMIISNMAFIFFNSWSIPNLDKTTKLRVRPAIAF